MGDCLCGCGDVFVFFFFNMNRYEVLAPFVNYYK